MTLLLAQEELDDDRHLTRGARVRDLAQSLTALHQKDFGDLLGADDVRYHVVGTDALEPGEVEVKFGHAVYLPSPGERTLYQVSTSRDGQHWSAVCPVYLNQRLALIGQDAESASHAVPGWPFGPSGAVLLVNDGPDAPIEVQVRPKGAFECTHDAGTGIFTISRRGALDAEGAPLQLLMQVERVATTAVTGPAPAPAVWKTRSAMPAADLTAVPVSHRPVVSLDATFAPLAQQRVRLAALALPRLSRYRDTGATALEITLDARHRLVTDGSDGALTISVDASDQLHATVGGSRQAVAAGAAPLSAIAPEMADRYCAMLMLADGPSAAASAGVRLVFGRSTPALAALRVLDSPRFLHSATGTASASADRIGLSRSAFGLEAAANGFLITRASASQALYHLDEQLRFVALVEDASAARPYLLPFGHHLAAGHYVMCFEA